MRTLVFNVEGQRISKDPGCDFEGLVSGTSGYLQCRFSLAPKRDWSDRAVVARFERLGEVIYEPVIGGVCMIPDEMSQKTEFRLALIGEDGESRLTTDYVTVRQSKGGSVDEQSVPEQRCVSVEWV